VKENHNRLQAPIQTLAEKQVSEEAVSVFLSYSRSDLEMLNKLNKQLASLVRTQKIKTWHDRDIEAGSEWEPEIQNRLNTADIIILLISADFMGSEYCYGNELKRAIERHDAGEARVIPVILRPCLWNLPEIPFSKLNVLPDHARPITRWEDPEEAYAAVALHISNLVEKLRQRKIEQETAQQQAAEQERLRQAEQLRQQQEALKQEKQQLAQQEAEETAKRERIQRERHQAAEQERLRQSEQLRQQQAAETERLKQQALEQQRPTETFEFQVATLRKKIETQSGVLGFGKKELITYSIDRTQKRTDYFTERLSDRVVLEMVAIPGGRFRMGSTERDAEQPVHEVQVAPFFLGKYPVTQAQWRVVAGLPKVKTDLELDPSRFKGSDRPVEKVSWWEAVEFCDRLNGFVEARISNKTKRTYRLPSEAEWEYACRAGTTTPFHFGETITADLANYDGNYTYGSGSKGKYRGETTPVGSFGVANAFGLYDMHGNVWEWCADHWHENYNGAPTDGSAWLTAEQSAGRLLRGGSWGNYPSYCRSACRYYSVPDVRYNYIGFRVVCGLA
jgi:formylglycine-generating enzyme required for sulfatase activity